MFKNVSTVCTKLCAVASGLIVLWAIRSIRTFFKEKDAEDVLDTGALLRHGIAFGLYLFGMCTSTVFLVIYNLDPTETSFSLFAAFYIADWVGQLISELLLCQIFWQWGTKGTPDDIDLEIEHYETLVVEDINEDEDLMGMIWNSLLRKRLN